MYSGRIDAAFAHSAFTDSPTLRCGRGTDLQSPSPEPLHAYFIYQCYSYGGCAECHCGPHATARDGPHTTARDVNPFTYCNPRGRGAYFGAYVDS